MENELIKIFKLEMNEELFKKALKPKSVGGNEDFKIMARDGDILLNKALMEIYKKAPNTGVLTQIMGSVHEKNCLVQLGYYLEIGSYIRDYYQSSDFSDNDIKEAIEALLSASSKVNDKATILTIIKELVDIIEKNQFYLENYKGRLLELYQENNYPLPEFILIDAGGPDHLKRFQSKMIDEYFGTNQEYISDVCTTRKEAEQNVAQKFMYELNRAVKPIIRKPRDKLSEIITEKDSKQSIHLQQITFSKLERDEYDNKLLVSENTGER